LAETILFRRVDMPFFAGFDTEVFSGQDLMAWLCTNSNLKWCGYYLAPAPNRPPSGWPGQYQALSANWGVAPIYVGQQDPRTSSDGYVPSSVLTSDQATIDGRNAADLVGADQFPPGTFIYLDWEYGGIDATGAVDYIKAWIIAVIGDGRFMPGIYCSHAIAAAIVNVLDTINPAPRARFWCWNVPTTASHPYNGDLIAVPTPDPANCEFPADVWQRDQNAVVTFSDGAPMASLQVDFSTSRLVNPAAPLSGADFAAVS
jgi:hypothetical protein